MLRATVCLCYQRSSCRVSEKKEDAAAAASAVVVIMMVETGKGPESCWLARPDGNE